VNNPIMLFRDLTIGQTFDFISDNLQFNSFFERCTKTGARSYVSESGLRCKVGTITVEVFHVEHSASEHASETPAAQVLRTVSSREAALNYIATKAAAGQYSRENLTSLFATLDATGSTWELDAHSRAWRAVKMALDAPGAAADSDRLLSTAVLAVNSTDAVRVQALATHLAAHDVPMRYDVVGACSTITCNIADVKYVCDYWVQFQAWSVETARNILDAAATGNYGAGLAQPFVIVAPPSVGAPDAPAPRTEQAAVAAPTVTREPVVTFSNLLTKEQAVQVYRHTGIQAAELPKRPGEVVRKRLDSEGVVIRFSKWHAKATDGHAPLWLCEHIAEVAVTAAAVPAPYVVVVRGVDVAISSAVILETREHFAKLAESCITYARAGKWRVNDLPRYVVDQTQHAADVRAGKSDHTATARQFAVYLATGGSVGLLG